MVKSSLPSYGSQMFRRLVLVIICLGGWEIVARAYGNPVLFPWPGYILSVSLPSISIFEGASAPDVKIATIIIGNNLAVTLRRLLSGLFIGVILGISFGLSMHFFERSRHANALLLTMIRSFPLFGLIPLFLFWFAGSEAGIYVYISWAVFLVVATGVFESVYNVPEKFLIQSALLGATRIQRFRTVILYAIQPEMAGTIRNVIGLSWAFSLGAEYLSAKDGLGYLVYLSYLYADMGKLFVFAFVYGICGFISYQILNWGSRRSKYWLTS